MAVPANAGPADEVRCPLCQAQFSLEDVLDIALPELIVVRQVAPLNLGMSAGADAPLIGSGLLGVSGGSLVGGLREGTLMGFGSSEFNGHGAGAATLDVPAAGFPDDGAGGYSLTEPSPASPAETGQETPSKPPGDSWNMGQDLNSALAEMPETTIAQGFAGEHVEGMDEAAGITATPRKKRKEPNMALEMVKAIFGGAIGLTVAYMILLWGCSRDPLQLGRKLPSWMVPTKMQGRR